MTEIISAAEVKELLAKGLSPASILYHVGLLCAQPGQTPESVATALGEKPHWVTTKLTKIEKLGGLELVHALRGSRCDSEGEMKALQEIRRIAPDSPCLRPAYWTAEVRREVSARAILKEIGTDLTAIAREEQRATPEGRLAELHAEARQIHAHLSKLRAKAEKLAPPSIARELDNDLCRAESAVDFVSLKLAHARGLETPRTFNGEWRKLERARAE